MKIISQKPTITRKDLEGVLDCLINDELATGNSIKTFENLVSGLIGMQYSLATNSLTSAYHLVFNALGIQQGDEVIIPSYFEKAPLCALSLTGGKAVLVDCGQNSIFPSEEAIKERITDRTRAIIIGHLCGFHYHHPILQNAGIPVIEDISHAFGTFVDDVPAGNGAAFTVASFAVSMIITTCNGGMVLTNNSKYYSKIKELRSGNGNGLGYDYCMSDIQGAMGITQVNKLNNLLERRRQIAKIYYDALKITNHKTFTPYGDQFAYQSFPILFEGSIEKVEKYWKKCGIEIENPIKPPLHTLLGLSPSDYPNSERLSKKLFTIPIYPTLTRDNIDFIARSISKFI